MIRSFGLVFGLLLPLAAQAEEVSVGKGAKLRGLDKVTGVVQDITVMNGGVERMGRIMIALGECRYPEGNPSGEAYAFLAIGEDASDDPVFTGWMIASSPAISAMEHRRYDVWVLRCITE
ncbi:DUF2155 domain-containing protein [Alisedimentitalea sp. MJ-SS2]|uniref:DUF2155 domain-containing protein n=1 Tax=Aliisedimentitalea sp. MJ-SS2 TaxID=3049795 RepID=UPI0029155F7F|nr:DUF2155 domain-containing protein [Alisedimentitalea sp. MJ-SS2]MDU8929083.1 DUF2155 domain-containing protein [Alisedimentitalea sp. MJ-SS2]